MITDPQFPTWNEAVPPVAQAFANDLKAAMLAVAMQRYPQASPDDLIGLVRSGYGYYTFHL